MTNYLEVDNHRSLTEKILLNNTAKDRKVHHVQTIAVEGPSRKLVFHGPKSRPSTVAVDVYLVVEVPAVLRRHFLWFSHSLYHVATPVPSCSPAAARVTENTVAMISISRRNRPYHHPQQFSSTNDHMSSCQLFYLGSSCHSPLQQLKSVLTGPATLQARSKTLYHQLIPIGRWFYVLMGPVRRLSMFSLKFVTYVVSRRPI